MLISLEEIKNYLRVDYEDDDALLEAMIQGSTQLCMDVARVDDLAAFSEMPNAKIAVMFAVAYQYEHREDADHKSLTLTLRALLFGYRKAAF